MTVNLNGTPQPRDDNWIPKCFFENRQKFPPEQLLQYAGKHIAWSWDGTKIVASAEELPELYLRLEEAGIPFSRTVHSYVDPIDVDGET